MLIYYTYFERICQQHIRIFFLFFRIYLLVIDLTDVLFYNFIIT